jgi:carbamoyl-phosphate synthase large subunit
VGLALQKLAETDFSGTVNISNGKSRSILEVLNVLKTHFQNIKYKNEISDIPYESSQADTTLFNQLVNNFKFKDIEETIPEIIAFEKTK